MKATSSKVATAKREIVQRKFSTLARYLTVKASTPNPYTETAAYLLFVFADKLGRSA